MLLYVSFMKCYIYKPDCRNSVAVPLHFVLKHNASVGYTSSSRFKPSHRYTAGNRFIMVLCNHRHVYKCASATFVPVRQPVFQLPPSARSPRINTSHVM